MRTLLVWVLLAGTAAAQGVIGGTVQGLPPQGQPRDPRAPVTTGTGVIRGRVTAADSGLPMRRATVNLSGVGRSRMAYTDSEGRYALTGLPPGTYTLSASPGTYRASHQGAAYGATGPFLPGKRLVLAAGQTIDNVDVALPRAGAIVGRVTDSTGEPVTRAQVTALVVRAGGEQQSRASVQTDDLGQFRLFGLQAGSYLVRAEARSHLFGDMEVQGEATGFAPTFAPGTPNRAEAAVFRVTGGAEVPADVRLIDTRVFTIRGHVISSSGETLRSGDVLLGSFGEGGSMTSTGTSITGDGTFTFRGVVPGTYELMARVQQPGPDGGPSSVPSIRELGVVTLDVSADHDNVVIQLRPGETVTGEIVFEEPAPAAFKATIDVRTAERRPFLPGGRTEVIGTRFTARDLFGRSVVRGSLTGGTAPGWYLKAVMLDGKDITDVPTAFTSGHSGRLQVLFSSRAQAIEGVVTDDAGKPTGVAQVMVFGGEEESWTMFSSRIRTTGVTGEDGKFAVRGLREGRYYVAAVLPGSVPMGPAPDRLLFESLKKVATEVVLNAGDVRTLDLRLVRFEQ